MQAMGWQASALQLLGEHPVGRSLLLGGKALVPSPSGSFEKEVLNCDPPKICVEGVVLLAVTCARYCTPATPRFPGVMARAASIPLV
jgi:hypothetical protein